MPCAPWLSTAARVSACMKRAYASFMTDASPPGRRPDENDSPAGGTGDSLADGRGDVWSHELWHVRNRWKLDLHDGLNFASVLQNVRAPQVPLAGRSLVLVPSGSMTGISRKLPDTERSRLKDILRRIVPEDAGVIIRTAAEGASEDELTRDVERLKARWEDIEKKSKGSAPQLLYGEPDLTLKVVRDLFTEDFSALVVQGADAMDAVAPIVAELAGN